MRQPDDPGVDPADKPRGLDTWAIVALAVLGGPFLLIAITIYFSWPAKSHSFYDAICCSDRDCAPIAANMVRETPAGYRVTINPGSHPMWPADKPAPLSILYEYRSDKIKPTRDGAWHVCINAAGDPLCLYVTGGGF